MSPSRSSVKYHIIPTEQNDGNNRGKRTCPKLTRYKIVAIVSIVILAIIFVVLAKSFHLYQSSTCILKGGNISGNKQEHLHLPHTKRRIPQCLIIGARKAGTRALLSFLNIHPDIQAVGRELHFFDDDDNYQLGYDWYRKRMPYSFKNQITIEKTPSYLVESVAPERVYMMNSSIKLILIVKDPVLRTISDYAQFRENKVLRQKPIIPFESLVIDPETGEINRSYNAVRRSIYCRHLQKWLRYFSMDQIIIVDGDKLSKAPWREIHKVESFLNIGHVVNKDKFIFNQTRGFYCIRNEDQSEKCLSRSKGRKHPDIQPWIVNKLKEFFHPFNEKFFKMLDRRFDWNDDINNEDENN
ncbi:heparan sulfate glucosamine 3-O-sulfotransferase 5 isoform X2 [Patella vulgata]|uniref:heparan sulfate glucosamine 3-O-sulfotransferase 5 isoform X2 n=1 Tax=Patella vulgata TaxID=6465 RepID=UPI00218009CA|nr:heparan sulfate glucosamine 3-O-sulfotransferase 5 isoform X2 [Patella vulgata]XP_050403024.1 heparan sulfate glucosamine 3-O-sulfotransferase 5 isoform X2 [Patella vulgata]XP_050403025.1 heparan sulfate glucosamine 3-O-sulfotransferase 5 isoform X2 [Patella vulgata]XP_050403026.1 heparan sulfate glucosamine 3-O-sulfotransferase 5 isoform X2 [Patella vulgata]XP_050403028.1 heparan sulfate glucosamine 3-O-sulfotransferase 5 isoform X2 [Patella vulgata]XP_055956567.1 heparan sulfate glucosami